MIAHFINFVKFNLLNVLFTLLVIALRHPQKLLSILNKR